MKPEFKKIIKAMIEKSGGSPSKIDLEKYFELISNSLIHDLANYWMGIPINKNPLDLMLLQEIMFEKRPDTIIECGTSWGGSAYFMATMMDIMNIDGRIITIDKFKYETPLYPKKDFVEVDGKTISIDMDVYRGQTHPKIAYILSDCLAAKIKSRGKTMVVLDCDHTADHVYAELQKFSPMVTVGQYLIVEDTNFFPEENGGPAAAVAKFLKKNKNFVVDHRREKFGVSSNPGGYLLRTA